MLAVPQSADVIPTGGGLYLQVSSTGTKSWVFRFTAEGRTREMGLGSLNNFTLAEARERTRECRQQCAFALDPIAAKQAAAQAKKIEAAKAVTFKDCAEKYMAAHEAAWRSGKHCDQWHNSLEIYVYPVIGALSVSAIGTSLVMKILEQKFPGEPETSAKTFWAARPETAGRVRGRIEAILDWATARGFRGGENPARWKGHLKQLLPARQKIQVVKHHPALPFTDLPAFMGALRAVPGAAYRALECAILTVLRTGEIVGARWIEFDLPAKVWTVPASRMKGGREHRVPLTARAIEILDAMPRENEFVFAGERLGSFAGKAKWKSGPCWQYQD
jgi:integrase